MQRSNGFPLEAGKRLTSYDLGGLTFVETEYPSSLKMSSHTHELAHFSLVLHGTYTERYGRRNRFGHPSMLILHPAGEDHEVIFPRGTTRIFTVIAKSSWLERLNDYARLLCVPREFSDGPPVRIATRLYHEFKSVDDVAPLAMEGLAIEVLAESARGMREMPEMKCPRWLRQAEELFHEKFSERLSLTDVASVVDVHPVHLSRVFRSRHRCTIGEYVRRLRVNFASRVLSTSSIPLQEIAQAAGFSDQSHFSRDFKRLTGLSPARYRKLYDQR